MPEFLIAEQPLIQVNTTKQKFDFDNIQGEVFHTTYLDYLYHAYANHYGIEIKPDYIWFTILNEMSREIKSNPKVYRHLFTDSNDKKEVSVATGSEHLMPVEDLLSKVFDLIPSGLNKDNIVLEFSTSTQSSKLAFSTSFLEAVSPYFSYSMFMCGFNKINVLGTLNDYLLIIQNLEQLKNIFDTLDNKSMYNYLHSANILVCDMINNWDNKDFWKNIFYVKRCGSGHQQQIYGWFEKFFYQMEGLKYIETYPKHVSKIQYKNLTSGNKYEMSVGFFSSKIENGYLVGDFEYGVNQIRE